MAEFVREDALENVAYLHDGSLEGLLCCVFTAYERHEQPTDIVCERFYQPRLEQSALVVETDAERAERVRRGIVREAGKDAFTAVMRASVCDGPDVGMAVYRFIRYVMDRPDDKKSSPVLEELANPVVADLRTYVNRAVNESEKMRQFIRFSHLENGVWFARCNPNASVVPLVMGYFAARLNDQPFIIYDENHDIAGVYDTSSWHLVQGRIDEVPAATAHDSLMEEAWRRFYDVLSVEARYNPELRRRFVPVRLWKNLPEMRAKGGTSMSPIV